jgi:hypothetical protein
MHQHEIDHRHHSHQKLDRQIDCPFLGLGNQFWKKRDREPLWLDGESL